MMPSKEHLVRIACEVIYHIMYAQIVKRYFPILSISSRDVVPNGVSNNTTCIMSLSQDDVSNTHDV